MRVVSLISVSGLVSNVDGFSGWRRPLSAVAGSKSTTSLCMSAEGRNRVVVTGLGVISGCGVTHDTFFDSCLEGKSSLRKVTRFDAANYPCSIASEVPDELFNPADYYTNPKNMKTNDRFTHFAVAASRTALKDAGIGDTPDTLSNPPRVGVMIGTAFGGVDTFERETLKLAKRPDRPKVRLF
jgi:3-oxoacyl-[acyl-carrier-protein] synthase II